MPDCESGGLGSSPCNTQKYVTGEIGIILDSKSKVSGSSPEWRAKILEMKKEFDML